MSLQTFVLALACGAGMVLSACSGGGSGNSPLPQPATTPAGTPIGTAQASTVTFTSAHGYTLNVSLQNVSSEENMSASNVSIRQGTGTIALSSLPAPDYSSATVLDAIPVTFGCGACTAGIAFISIEFTALTGTAGALPNPWVELISLSTAAGLPAGTSYDLNPVPVAIVPPPEPFVITVAPGAPYAFMIANY